MKRGRRLGEMNMQRTMILIAAAALIATPAAAQDNATDANGANVAVENTATANDAVAMNDMTAVPDANMMAPVPAETAPVAAPAPPPAQRGFPWGVIGLVGLVGLLGRRRSD